MPKLFYKDEDEDAVSVIVGAMLLVLITVVAAASLAVIISDATKKQAERDALQRSVNNENLSIMSAVFSYALDIVEPEITNGSAPGIINGSSDKKHWDRINLTVMNMNAEDTNIMAVSVNNVYAMNYTSTDGYHNVSLSQRLWVPESKSKEIQINMSGNFTKKLNITTQEPVKIQLTSQYIKHYEKTFYPPVANAKVSIATQDLGPVQRDYLELDGSGSTDDEGIDQWIWIIGDHVDESTIEYSILQGKNAEYISSHNGAKSVRLLVKDGHGMECYTQTKIIPASTRFNPPTYVYMKHLDNNLTAVVTNAENKPVKGAVVNFIKVYDVYNNMTLDTWSGITDINGEVKTNITGGQGTIRVVSGKLDPIEWPVYYKE